MKLQEKATAGRSPIGLIGVPSSAGARMAGQEQAPRALRCAGLVPGLRSRGREVLDVGDLAEVTYAPDERHPQSQNLELVRGVLERVVQAVDSALAAGAWPLVLGGDCTVTIGVLAALTRHFPDLGLIYFDGDLDLNTPETTLTGILDGMALAHVLGEGAAELSRLGSRHPLVEEPAVTLFGYSVSAGGLDPVEIGRLRGTRMAKVPMEEIEGRAANAAAEALRNIESRVEHVLVHFDVDVVDAGDFPAVDVPHRPGLRLAEAGAALGVFLESPKVLGLVATEFNARLDRGGMLARRLGETISGAMPGGPSRETIAAAAGRDGRSP